MDRREQERVLIYEDQDSWSSLYVMHINEAGHEVLGICETEADFHLTLDRLIEEGKIPTVITLDDNNGIGGRIAFKVKADYPDIRLISISGSSIKYTQLLDGRMSKGDYSPNTLISLLEQ